MSRPILILVGALVVAVSACGSSSKSESAPTTAASTVPAASTTTTMPVAGQTYSSKTFVVPFSVTVQAALASPPDPESANIVSWNAAASSSENKVRFMVPVELYRPGSTAAEAPPADFLTYLQGQAKDGAEISNSSDITVGGNPATLMDISRTVDATHPDGSLDGSFGCPEKGADRSDGCFGPQADLLLRMAVVKVGDSTLLIWARVNKAQPDPAFLNMFERMLTTVQFQ